MKDRPHIPALGTGEPTSPPNQSSGGKSPGYMRRLHEHLDANPDLIGSMLIKGLPINYGEMRYLLHEVELLGALSISLNTKLVLSETRRSEMLAALISAAHALRSYQYGNAATDLAREIADAADAAIAKAKGAV